MKCISVFLLCLAASYAADFNTGQAARAVIGQQTFTAADPTSTDTVVGAVGGLAYANDTLFVADSNRVGAGPLNHRVLLFQHISSMLPKPTDQLQYDRKCPVCVGQATVVLGQPDFTTTTETIAATQSDLRLPTAVASDGTHLVVADTNHNRVLIWNSIPQANNAPADVVLGQPDFTSTSIPGNSPNAKSMRGPQGVWIQDGKLYVADTQNNRVLIYNHIPTVNGTAADMVLGQKDFTTFVEPDLTQQNIPASASNLLNPVAVTSDGVHLFVTDLGNNRVLIWNSIPTTNDTPADVVVGQPDMNSSAANNAFTADSTGKQSPVLCTVSNGTDSNNNPTYPGLCKATISFPRFALSDGNRLFVADGGNDRILVFSQLPTQNGQSADFIIGEVGEGIDQASDASDSMITPMSLAWDGTNLYVSDTYNRRILVYSVGENVLPFTAVRNAASFDIHAVGSVQLTGSIQTNDSVTITINDTDYTYKIVDGDTFDSVVNALVSKINAGSGDPNVFAAPNTAIATVLLTARASGSDGNNVTYSTATSANALITSTAAGANLSGGGDAAQIAPGTVVSILGSNLANGIEAADLSQNPLPQQLAGAEVYFNGIRAPLLYASPNQINAQVPWEFTDTTNVNAFVRRVASDGTVTATTPVGVPIVQQNPGLFAMPNGDNPPPGVLLHGSSNAIGVVSVDGAANPGDVATVTIEDRSYSYTVQTDDTLDNIMNGLVALINQDPKVTASPSGVFDRIILKARVEGPDGNGIQFGASAPDGAQVIMTAIGTQLCCANVANSLVTPDNPAVPGEILIAYATGLGLPVLNDSNASLINTGYQYPPGSPNTQPVNFVSSIAAGKTANVLSASLLPGTVGLFQVVLQLNPDIPTDPQAQLTIAQDIFVSNIVTFPVANPAQ
ncbi:MAG TPA: hypothetical protein VG675_18445 [Bryobacteraceae bacterium]|nr:hypothetical protein [Bryobacteraceae bacterium]